MLSLHQAEPGRVFAFRISFCFPAFTCKCGQFGHAFNIRNSHRLISNSKAQNYLFAVFWCGCLNAFRVRPLLLLTSPLLSTVKAIKLSTAIKKIRRLYHLILYRAKNRINHMLCSCFRHIFHELFSLKHLKACFLHCKLVYNIETVVNTLFFRCMSAPKSMYFMNNKSDEIINLEKVKNFLKKYLHFKMCCDRIHFVIKSRC